MKLVIVQLSDIHLSSEKWPKNPILDRATKIESAIKSLFLQDITACILLVSGDIAYAGLPAEYEMGMTLLSQIRNDLTSMFGEDNCHAVLLPGNHDCDFKKDNAARQTLVDDIRPDAFEDGSILDICTKPQDEFFQFCARFQSRTDGKICGVKRAFDIHNITVGEETITIRVINTAWASRVHETIGCLPMPLKALRAFLHLDSGQAIVITAFHHPYAWMEKTASKEFRISVEETSDLIFTGHEHERQSYSKTKFTGEHNEYIEAGPLQENGDPEQSEFNVILVDTKEQSYLVNHFAWVDGIYERVNDLLPRPFIRNNSRLRSEFVLNSLFEDQLNDTDIEYHHPFKDTVKLDDIFIYPELREFSLMSTSKSPSREGGRGPSSPSKKYGSAKKRDDDTGHFYRSTIKSREVISYILRKRLVIVSAPERGGKTAFARTIFKDLWRNGKIPMLLSGDGLDAKTAASLPRFLDQNFGSQYRSPRVSRYWDIEQEKRAVIIDDFNKLPNVRAIRDGVLKELQARFSLVIIIGGATLRFQELISSGHEANLLADFTHTEFLTFGQKLRSDLIRRWYELGRRDLLPDEEVAQQVATLERIVGIVLGRDLLPPFPSYVLLLLQELELRQPVDVAIASYGKLYQASMTASLAKKGFDVDTALSYLSEFAYAFFREKTDSFDEQGYLNWHALHVKEYMIVLDFDTCRTKLVSAGLLSYSNGTVRFKVKAAFYFFVAYYLSTHRDEESCQEEIKLLTSRLYREDAANIILFLCHINPTPFVIVETLANAAKLFDGRKESDLQGDLKFTDDLIARLPQSVLDAGDPEKRRQQRLEAQDAISNNDDPSDEMYQYRREEETDLDSDNRRHLAQLNAAMKTIQIQGQIVRSFAGSLKGDRKKQLVESCYALSLRLLGFVFEAFNLTKEEYGKHLKKRLTERNPKLTDDAVTGLTNTLIFMLIEMCTLAVIRHVASSVGSERLSPTFKEIFDQQDRFSIKTLDAAIQLEHFKNIPEDLVVDLFEEADKNLLMQSVIKNLAFDRLYYFHCPYDVRQRICSKLDIKLLTAVVLNNDRKRD